MLIEWVQAAGCFAVLYQIGLTRKTLLVGTGVAAIIGISHARPGVASVAAVGSVLLVRAPQLWQLRHRVIAHQVSSTTWEISAGANLLWVGWGISGQHPTMIIGAGIAAITSGAIALAARHHPAPVLGSISRLPEGTRPALSHP
jgi:hypothetical protein